MMAEIDLAVPAATATAHTYTIHRYPTRLIDRWTLEDGRVVTLRPVLPQDAALTQALVRQMSPESRANRYLVGLAELPPALLARFTCVDYRQHMALVAETVVYGREILVGEARYAVESDGVSADFAIAVADDWHQAGIGSRLLRMLEHAARDAGIARFTGDVLGTNRKALDFMRQRGFSVRTNLAERRLVRVEKQLDQGGAVA
jgi:acetyltransferase